MNTDQARRLVALHDNADRALANLRNANAMSTDDPRATEMLENAGDAYRKSLAELRNAQLEAVPILLPDGKLISHGRGESGPIFPEGSPDAEGDFEAGKVAWIATDGGGSGIVVDRDEFARRTGEEVAEGHVALLLPNGGTFRGEDLAEGAVITFPTECLSLERPADAPSASEKPSEGSGKDPAPKAA